MDGVDAPSDLGEAAGERRVGGRLLGGGPGELVLGDALRQLIVEPSAPVALQPGALCVFEGWWDGRRLRRARLRWTASCPEPRGEGEQSATLWSGLGPRLEQRARARSVVRRYFEAQGFLEVETPWLVPRPSLDSNVEPLPAEGGWLITSPELHMKRLLVGGLPRIFQLARCARREELGPWHEPEFTLLEWYRSYSGMDEVMADTECVVRGVVEALSGRATVQLPGRPPVELAAPFERLSVREAFRRHAAVHDAVALARDEPSRYFELLVGSVEPALADYPLPVFLTGYPLSQAALARPSPADPSVAERFELYVAGVELCNGFGELTDGAAQRARWAQENAARQRAGQPVYPLDERFLEALAEGLPPSGGNALGFDRLVALALGAPSVASVLTFPAARR